MLEKLQEANPLARLRRSKKLKKGEVDRESHDSGIVSRERDKIVERHFREHPEGDPAVRRRRPVRGRIAVEEPTEYPGIMRVSYQPRKRPVRKRAARRKAGKRRAA